MKLNKGGICTASNVTYDPTTHKAFSYGWWGFVWLIEGRLVFNNYYYSNTTTKHQSKVRSLLWNHGTRPDLTLPVPLGLHRPGLTLEQLIVEAEEYLCDKYLHNLVKEQERRGRAKRRLLPAIDFDQPLYPSEAQTCS